MLFKYVLSRVEQVVAHLFQAQDKRSPLSTIRDEVMNATKELKGVGKTQLECLIHFMKSQKLVKWLREKLAAGRMYHTYVLADM